MDPHALAGILLFSFALGLVHAFDADHVLAVSSLAARRQGWKSGVAYALKWALGHGGVLLLIAAAALWFRLQLPEYIVQGAEKLVGVILIAAGISLCWSLRRQRISLTVHRHGDLVHTHLTPTRLAPHVSPTQAEPMPRGHNHAPVLVGIVHGLAGSAPALALIPATLYQPWLALGYLVVFSAGVLIAMVSFGLLLGHGQRLLQGRHPRLLDGSRALLGLGAAALGVFWLSA